MLVCPRNVRFLLSADLSTEDSEKTEVAFKTSLTELADKSLNEDQSDSYRHAGLSSLGMNFENWLLIFIRRVVSIVRKLAFLWLVFF